MMAGPADVVERGWRIRRRLGGQMRQAGFLAAAGLYALEHHRARLAEDHARARRLAEGVAYLPGVRLQTPETNVVMIDVSGTGMTPPELVARLREQGVGMVPFGPTRLRAVLHLDVDDAGVELAIGALSEVLRGEGAPG
jgi:threonine aldolase